MTTLHLYSTAFRRSLLLRLLAVSALFVSYFVLTTLGDRPRLPARVRA